MKRVLSLLLPLALAACAGSTPFASTHGRLAPGQSMQVRVASGQVDIYAPRAGAPRNRFSIAATALPNSTPRAPRVRTGVAGLTVDALDPLRYLLVRVPQGVNLKVAVDQGALSVTDVTGKVDAFDRDGNIHIMVSDYAQARADTGNVTVFMGATRWPGTLHFSSMRGDVEVWIVGKANFTVHLHTDRGTIFTNFNLRGHAKGLAETIDGSVNGGGAQRIDIGVHNGSIRLMRLMPQT